MGPDPMPAEDAHLPSGHPRLHDGPHPARQVRSGLAAAGFRKGKGETTMTALRMAALPVIGMATVMTLGPVTVEAAGGPSAAPYDVEIFVRGSFNGWGTGHRMKFDAKGNTYVAQVELVPGGHEFKIASRRPAGPSRSATWSA